jgi:hypothetical protein
MPELTRRREKEGHQQCWHIYYGDVHVGTIGERAGVPVGVDQWGWKCGFYPGAEPNEHRGGSASTFEQARAAFEVAWQQFLARRTREDFAAYRRHCDYQAWKQAMWDANCRMPTQVESGVSSCTSLPPTRAVRARTNEYAERPRHYP